MENSAVVAGVALAVLLSAYAIHASGQANLNAINLREEAFAKMSEQRTMLEVADSDIRVSLEASNAQAREIPRETIERIGEVCESAILTIGVNGHYSCNDYCATWNGYPHQGACLLAQQLGNGDVPTDLKLSSCASGGKESAGMNFVCVCC